MVNELSLLTDSKILHAFVAENKEQFCLLFRQAGQADWYNKNAQV